MGADGGSIPDRRDLVRTKGKAEITDRALLRELFFFCALSKNLLSRPVVLDPIGKLYNKDALIEYFLDKSKYGDGDQICGHLKGVKDLLTLSLTDNPQYVATSTSTTALASDKAPFICPLSLKEMNGAIPFIALRNCGCVFSDNAIRSVVPNLSRGTAASAVISDDKAEQAKPIVEAQDKVACPNCTKEFDPTPANSILPINPSKNVQDALMDQLLISRAAAKSSKKRKAAVADTAVDGVQKVNGDGVVDGDIPKKATRKSEVPHRSTASPASNPTADGKSTLHRSVHQKLAEQEQKRLAAQAGMSDAVKAMFKPKEEEKRGGAAEFFGRTFNRYAI